MVYKLTNPIHYSLTPSQLTTFLNYNNFWSDTNGQTEVSYAIHDAAPIRAAKHRIAANEPHIETMSGSIATFKTDMAIPLKSLVVDIPVTQEGSGDPSPENVRPFVARTDVFVTHSGKNLFDKNNFKTLRGVSTNLVFSKTTAWGLEFPCLPNTTYTFTRQTTVCNRFNVYDCADSAIVNGSQFLHSSGNTSGTTLTFTTKPTAKMIFLYLNTASTSSSVQTNFNNTVAGLQIEFGDTSTTYDSYRGESITVSWQSQVGIIYGGTLTLNADGSCDIQPTKAEMDLGSLTWTYLTNGAYPYFRSGRVDAIKGSHGITTLTCSNYLAIDNKNYTDFRAHDYNNQICCSRQTGYTTVTVQDSRYTDAEAFKTAVTGVTIVYDLATLPSPIHIDNIGQLYTYLGTNNIWSDAGTTTVKYWTH